MRKLFVIALVFICTTATASIKISKIGKTFIKTQENCSLISYRDANGYSIGYGHHSKDIQEGLKITQQEADKLFDEDIKRAETSVQRLLDALPYTYNFSQGFIDGFVSFVYNCGESGARNSTFYKRLQQCRVKKGIINIDDLFFSIAGIKVSKISCKTHEQRRYKEHKMMLN